MDRYSMRGLIDAYSQGISEDLNWGLEIANILIEEQEWEHDLWKSIFSGFEKSDYSEEKWGNFFDLLLQLNELRYFEDEISSLLEGWIENFKNRVSLELLNKADKIAEKLIEEVIDHNKNFKSDLDWLTLAINRSAGKLCQFYLFKISRELENSDNRSLENHYKKIFNRLINHDSDFSNLFVVVLISQVHFFVDLDYEWTKEKLIPLLSSEEKEKLFQAWNGFLVWGKPNERFLNDLIPAYINFFEHVNSLDYRLKESFCNHIASICVFSSYNPLQDYFLFNFVKIANSEVLESLSRNIKACLKKVDEEAHRKIWEEWLRTYLTKRSEGIPIFLTDNEKENFLLLIIYMRKIIHELAEILMKLDFPNMDHTFFFMELNESSVPEEKPEITAKLLDKILDSIQPPFSDDREVAKIVEVLSRNQNKSIKNDLLNICNSLSRLGYSGASDLKKRVEVSSQENN